MSAYKESPVAVTGLSTGSGTQAIGVGTKHACALVNGGVKCWGDNSQGQLGNNTPITSPTAVPVNVTGLTSGVQALAVGPYHNCALVNGGIQCWGKNDKGQTGTVGGSGLYESLPVAVNGITSNARSISAGTGYTCALVNHGIKCWGDNSLSQLGDNSATTPTLPVNPYGASQGISQMAAGSTHTCIIVNGGVKCWGLNSAGQIGDNSTTDRHIPTSVYGLTAGAQTLSAGNLYSCSLVNGGVQCWGDNSLGQTGQSSPTTGNIVPASVYSLTSEVQMMASGKNQSCALVNGGVKCWGSNVSGQLGNNTTGGSSALPVSVTNLTANVNSIAVGESHACALVGGGVKCWGSNSKGQLGDNSTTDSSIPVAVTGLSSGGVTAIAAGSSHTCALVNGGVQCWGYNASGQLGDNSTTDSLVPVQVTALSAAGVTTVVTGASHSCAISQGGIQCWGDNSSGQIGANSVTASFLVPTAVLGLSTGVQELSSGDNHVCALYNGTLKCWGNNTYGQLGNNSTTLLRAPASISGL
jgi:alpha-tubulin suppressor-like RCC1 family protein